MKDRYVMAHSCPNCGEKDSYGAWKGARMISSSWGHDFSCCSDECGIQFAQHIYGKSDTKKGRAELRALWEKLSDESGCRLSGEPYYGYDAENTLRYRTQK